ncbi:MAG TPA: hypothetical protein GXX75_00040 [Clostridiales bacterium]|nr:hypothetical protein [Clostridiales bacterium]
MPTLKNMEIPKPKDWQDFERLVESYAQIKWPGCLVALFGGNGQRQYGVDIFIRNKEKNYIGIQCKKVNRLSYSQIEKEIEKAMGFKPGLKHYYIAASVSRNAVLQEKVNIFNSQCNNEKIPFTVDIIFWEDIIELIMTDGKVFGQHYPQLSQESRKEDRFAVYAFNNENSVIGNSIIIKPTKKMNIQKGPIPDTIGNDTYMKNYAKYLIDRYLDYKKANTNFEGGKMKYALIYNAIKKETGFKWDETPYEKFDDLCTYLQKRIDNTILGKLQKRKGIKNYRTFKEYMYEKQGIKSE